MTFDLFLQLFCFVGLFWAMLATGCHLYRGQILGLVCEIGYTVLSFNHGLPLIGVQSIILVFVYAYNLWKWARNGYKF